jgi:heme exporter protein D
MKRSDLPPILAFAALGTAATVAVTWLSSSAVESHPQHRAVLRHQAAASGKQMHLPFGVDTTAVVAVVACLAVLVLWAVWQRRHRCDSCGYCPAWCRCDELVRSHR